MARRDRIFVPEIGRSFESVAAAARELGIDSSNIGKVLRGARKRAGGYSFVRNPTPEEMKEALQAAERMPLSQRQAAARAESEKRQKLLQSTHNLLVALNRQQKDKRKAGVLEGDEIFKRIMQHADFVGYNKQGGFDTSLKNLRQFTTDELQNIQDYIHNIQREYITNSDAPRNIASFALQFGVTEKQMNEYAHLLPMIFELYRLSHDEDKYKVIQQTVEAAIQDGASPQNLEAFLIDAKNYYSGNTKEDITAILDRYSDVLGNPAIFDDEARQKFSESLGDEF